MDAPPLIDMLLAEAKHFLEEFQSRMLLPLEAAAALGLLSTGSQAGRTLSKRRDGSMYSQAYGRRNPSVAAVICEVSQTSLQMVRLYERRIGEPLKGRPFRLVQWLNVIRHLHETSQGSTNLARKFWPMIFLGYASQGDGKEILVADIEGLEILDAS